MTAQLHFLPWAPGQQSPSENASSPSQSFLHLQGRDTIIRVISGLKTNKPTHKKEAHKKNSDLVTFTMPLGCKSAFQRGSLEQPQLPPALFSCIQAHSHQLVAQKAA